MSKTNRDYILRTMTFPVATDIAIGSFQSLSEAVAHAKMVYGFRSDYRGFRGCAGEFFANDSTVYRWVMPA